MGDGVHALDRARREPGIQAVPVQALQVGGGEGLELDASQGWDYMHSNQPLIALEGNRPHAAFDRVIQPPLQVLLHSDAARIELNPAVPVGHRLGQLRCHFLTRPAVDMPALRALRCVDREPRHPTAVIPLSYRSLAVAPRLTQSSVPPWSARALTMLQLSINTTSI